MNSTELSAQVVWQVGPVEITSTTLTNLLILGAVLVLSLLLRRRMNTREPRGFQVLVEGGISLAESAIAAVAPNHVRVLFPFITTLWLYLGIANLVGLIPGLHSPTRDLSTTSAMAMMVFFSVHWFGITDQGLKNYLRHYLSPSPWLLPFHIISEISRTVALAVRLFGNMMSLEMAAMLVLLVAGFLAPIPLLILHIIEALVQAYIFGMLALIYVAGGIQTQQLKHSASGDAK